MKKLIALLLALVMIVGMVACGNTNTPVEPDAPKVDAPAKDDAPVADPQGAYEETVNLTVGMSMNTGALADGTSTMMDNAYKTYIKDTLNIDYTFYYEDKDALGYEQAIDMAIVSEEFPDIFYVKVDTLKELTEMDAIWDMTEIFETYASDELKQLYADYGTIYGEYPLAEATIDGKLMGIPATTTEGNHSMTGVWIRSDWMQTLGVDPDPDGDKMITLDDIERVAQAFVDNDPGNSGDPEGITMIPWIGLGNFISPGLVNRTYGARHLNWFYDDAGNPYYGTFGSEENPSKIKEALTWWRDMYDKGLVDPDFISTQWSDESLGATWATGRSGIVFAPEQQLFFSIAYNSSPDCHFSFYALQNPDGKTGGYQSMDGDRYIMVVSKDCENPEALVKLFNIREQVNNDAALQVELCGDNGTPKTMGPVPVVDEKANWFGMMYDYAVKYQEGTITKDEIPAIYHSYLDVLDKYKQDPKSLDAGERSKYDIIMEGASTLNKMATEGKLYNEFENIILTANDMSPTCAEKFSAELYPLEEEYVMKIISGQKTVDDWDEFVELWHEYGGNQILKEMNEWVAANN